MTDFPLMKSCPACGYPHGVEYVCPKLAIAEALKKDLDQKFLFGDAKPGDPPPKGIFAEEKFNLFPVGFPLLPKKAPSIGKIVGFLSIDGVTYEVPSDLIAAIGGDIGALVAALKKHGTPVGSPMDVADAFFLAFVEESDRTPVAIPFVSIARDAYLAAALAASFGDTDPRI
jgi:hypothetical protein